MSNPMLYRGYNNQAKELDLLEANEPGALRLEIILLLHHPYLYSKLTCWHKGSNHQNGHQPM